MSLDKLVELVEEIDILLKNYPSERLFRKRESIYMYHHNRFLLESVQYKSAADLAKQLFSGLTGSIQQWWGSLRGK
jgi:hypothetical protein